MMNGLQSLPQWKQYFNNPKGGKLGLLNAIQVGLLSSSRDVFVLTRMARTLARLVCLRLAQDHNHPSESRLH